MNKLPQRSSYRLQKFDYTTPGYYFVTICVQNRLECFGKVKNDLVVLDEQGIIAEKFWKEVPNHYPNVGLDVFVVMPNHIHGIVIIKQLPADGRPYKQVSLSKIIGSYKNVVSKAIRNINSNFEWQHSFYDHVIRSQEDLTRIREYIVNNPKQWELDEYNQKFAIIK